MAKHRLQRNRRMQARRVLLLAALMVGLGVSPVWAGPQSSQPKTKTAQAGGQNKAKTTPVKSAQPAVQPKGTTASSSLGAGKRDPFKMPEFGTGKEGAGSVANAAAPGVLPAAERGLVISQLMLEGVVREQTENKMIAVVTNETKRAYFLHENQSVYNGVVSKITPDAVYFTENVLDANGRVTTREVVKRLGSAPGEER